MKSSDIPPIVLLAILFTFMLLDTTKKIEPPQFHEPASPSQTNRDITSRYVYNTTVMVGTASISPSVSISISPSPSPSQESPSEA